MYTASIKVYALWNWYASLSLTCNLTDDGSVTKETCSRIDMYMC